MKVCFVGDIHGYYEHLAKITKRDGVDKVVQVGDFGIMPTAGYNLPANLHFAVPTHFIEGNHDDIDYIEDVYRQNPINNLHYMPRGSTVEWDGLRVGFMGGASSIDKYARTEGVDWFRREVPTLTEIERFAQSEPDVAVTHEAPAFIIEKYFGYVTSDCVAYDLQNALKHIPEFKPKVWFFGHHHKQLHVEDGGILFCGLSCFGQEGDEAMLDTHKLSVTWGS